MKKLMKHLAVVLFASCGLVFVSQVGCDSPAEPSSTTGDVGAGSGLPDPSLPGPSHGATAAIEETPAVPADGKSFAFSALTFNLPARFSSVPLPLEGIPDNMQVQVWRSMLDEQTPEAVLAGNAIRDAKMVEDANADMRQALVNHGAGTAKQMRIQIMGRGETETLHCNGVDLTNFVWVGKMDNAQEVGGKIFGLTHGDEFIVFNYISFGGEPDKVLAEIDKYLSTAKLQ